MFNPSIKFRKMYKHNSKITFLNLNSDVPLLIFYHQSMINTENLQKTLIKDLSLYSNRLDNGLIVGLKEIEEKEIDQNIFAGCLIIYCYKTKKLYSLNNENIPTRQTTDPLTDISITGARDALVESNEKNIALIQKRIKNKDLCIEDYYLGEETNTKVNLIYIDKISNGNIINNIKEKLINAKLDSLVNIGQLQSILCDNNTLTPLLNYTSRPDFISESILKGRVVILIEGMPLGLIGPATFFYFLDYHDSLSENYYSVLFDRLLFIISLFLSVFIAPFITAVISYYPEFLPLSLIASTINARKGIAPSFISELIISEVLFQIFRVAGTRLSQAMSSSLLVVGSLLLGRAVIEAGILSQEALFVAAISVVSSYVISNNSSFNTSVNFMRWFLFLCTILFGFYGMSIGFLLLSIYLASKTSFSVPYLYPVAPFNLKAIINSIIPSNYLNKRRKKNEK